ncbi:MAG: ATP-dependent zinc metalloprotease FtsH [Lachnospiraceae bacterium]|nr:ATP-dependent zinc metalloprotease FtsH [Lachnospiraceae bacterium]
MNQTRREANRTWMAEGGNGYPGGGQGGNNRGNGNKKPEKPSPLMFIIVAVICALVATYIVRMLTGGGAAREVSYNEFLGYLRAGSIEEATIESDRITFDVKSNNQLYGPSTYYTALIEEKETVTNMLISSGVDTRGVVESGSNIILSILLTYVLPILLMWGLMSLLFRRMGKGGGGGIFGVGKSNAKMYGEKETGITFKDVAGEEEAKESLVEIVDFLHNPGKYAKIGAKIPKGALLVGPPGTGKTLLAKAVAGEAHVPFFSLAGSDFVEMYVGVGASRVRDLFKEAEKNAPCIVFIDEIDAIGRSRDSKYGGGNEEREQTLNQLLSEMDGFDAKKGIILLAATNRPEILDKALLRPGRFDRRVIVEEPDLKGRVDILAVHAKNVKMDETVDLNAIALATVGAVGADLANMINESAILAVKRKREFVCQQDLLDAVELVSMGKEKKDKILSPEERKIVTYHEVGHALISALQKNSEPVQKITIIPRMMGALGYVLSYPEEEKSTQTELELRAELVSLLGGRAAEDIVFDTVTTGAANDIEKATRIARAMVTRFGMSKKFGLMGLETVESQYLDRRAVLNCADETAADIDNEVMKILKESYKEAKRLLKENRDVMDQIADYLIKKETITGHEFMEIFCKAKGIPMPTEDKGKNTLRELRKAQEERRKAEEAEMAKIISGGKEEKNPEDRTTPKPPTPPQAPTQTPPPVPPTSSVNHYVDDGVTVTLHSNSALPWQKNVAPETTEAKDSVATETSADEQQEAKEEPKEESTKSSVDKEFEEALKRRNYQPKDDE